MRQSSQCSCLLVIPFQDLAQSEHLAFEKAFRDNAFVQNAMQYPLSVL